MKLWINKKIALISLGNKIYQSFTNVTELFIISQKYKIIIMMIIMIIIIIIIITETRKYWVDVQGG